MTGYKARSVFDRYNIVSRRDLRDAAKKLNIAAAQFRVTKQDGQYESGFR
jgi:hypothetical protein